MTQYLPKAQASISLRTIPLAAHEHAMSLAIEEGKKNPAFPFGAVITDARTGDVLARGVNNSRSNPSFHGEIVCLNDYVSRHGNKGWGDTILYTTGEPCPMCMSALIWAGVGGVVFASSIETLVHAGMNQIEISSKTVAAASPFYKGEILGGILETQTDALFMGRPK
jgi:tRNA(Arg) A34 adenosine deaminase TadA